MRRGTEGAGPCGGGGIQLLLSAVAKTGEPYNKHSLGLRQTNVRTEQMTINMMIMAAAFVQHLLLSGLTSLGSRSSCCFSAPGNIVIMEQKV